jgi:hypothetical protein
MSGATLIEIIWKAIDANPGITRDDLFAKIEHETPPGLANRRYWKVHGVPALGSVVDQITTTTVARRYVLGDNLQSMCRSGSITKANGGYRTLRELNRRDAADRVDPTGTSAVDHLNAAYALRTFDAALDHGGKFTEEELQAAREVANALRRLLGA